jgi:hypothetical protein
MNKYPQVGRTTTWHGANNKRVPAQITAVTSLSPVTVNLKTAAGAVKVGMQKFKRGYK